MKVLKDVPTSVEIGPLDGVIRLPMAGRKSRGVKSICDICRNGITDDFFIGGFKTGFRNMLFHERCADEQGISVEGHPEVED